MLSDNEKFINFIKLHGEDYYKTLKELSKSDNHDSPLINLDFKMYALDDICQNSTKFFRNGKKHPKTTDALYYTYENDKLSLYFIEFKGEKLEKKPATNDLNDFIFTLKETRKFKQENGKELTDVYTDEMYRKIINVQKKYADDILMGLRIKPFESLFVALPVIYEEFFEKNESLKEDFYIENFKNFLNQCNKYYWIIYYSDDISLSSSKINDHFKLNRNKTDDLLLDEKDDGNINYDSYEGKLKYQNDRFEIAGIFEKCQIYTRNYFKKIVKKFF